ncbi:MAG: DUF2336 domain-containing protein [Proteobacteria bacterium]|nr:DUF2336 domain-containing protein [Pseudomonadota bacterium]
MNAPAAASEAERVRQGSHAGTPAAVLRSLARDSSVTVRASLALNPGTPHDVHEMLAADADERVRALLGGKLARLLPGLSGSESLRCQRQVYDTLGTLVSDTAVRVRAAIADAVKAMPEAPRDLVLKLARDAEVSVADPVIRLSPLLTSEDLLGLLDEPPFGETAQAVARRPGLTEAVSDAIAAGADTEAIRLLLSNPSAQIREATLDALVARAAAHVDWHAPLVKRPVLSARAQRALADIVAAHLLEELAARGDLDPTLLADLRRRLGSRLEAAPAMQAADPITGGGVIGAAGGLGRGAGRETPASVEAAAALARDLAEAGQLTAGTILAAVGRGEAEAAAAMLAVAASVPRGAVQRAVALRSAKGLVALAWRAEFGMRDALALQTALGGLGPHEVLRPGPSDRFPLAPEELRWQIDFLAKAAH